MVHKIAIFNNRGGVGKTTITFNLGWMLASMGKRVILVDADSSQCDLTNIVIAYSTHEEIEEHIYKNDRNIKAGLAPAFELQPRLIKAVECIPVEGQDGLFLLPGHIGAAEYEATLGLAQSLSGSIISLKNLPGSISYLLEKTAEKFSADYMLIDMNPNANSLTQNLFMISDFFLVPTIPDSSSVRAIDSLINILPKWHKWAEKASALKILREADYPFPKVTPLFLGTIIVIEKYRIKKLTDRIDPAVINDAMDRMFQALSQENMTFPRHIYSAEGITDAFCLTQISNFDSLISISQDFQTPVFALTTEQIEQAGGVLATTLNSQEQFKDAFSTLADRVINLTSNAVCV